MAVYTNTITLTQRSILCGKSVNEESSYKHQRGLGLGSMSVPYTNLDAVTSLVLNAVLKIAVRSVILIPILCVISTLRTVRLT